MTTSGVPFDERGGVLRGCLDLLAGRFPRFLFGGRLGDGLLPVFHFHDVTAQDLEPKLRYLAENGYRTANSEDILAHVKGATKLDRTHVGLCFDDAWASLWTVAAPLLKQYGLTAITYAIPGRMHDSDGVRQPAGTSREGSAAATASTAQYDEPFVTWPELRALHGSGIVDVQCHTDSHSRIFCSGAVIGFVTPAYAATPLLNRPQLSPAPRRFVNAEDLGAPLYAARSRMSDGLRINVSIDLHARCVAHVARAGGAAFFAQPDWRAQLTQLVRRDGASEVERHEEQVRAIEDELDRGRAVLNERLATRTVNHVCLPWGVSGTRTVTALARLGFGSAFANRLRGVHAVQPGDDPYWLKRLPNKYIFRLPGRGRRIWH
ncbi:MAG TPA: polysaccharide deacetylase family protein [Vicinamibacterales bacterium]|nr:polysaccharide deacetylase family protein [Vicinamibacterales bacterium]